MSPQTDEPGGGVSRSARPWRGLSCLALGNCLVAEAASYITSPGKLKHYVLFNWEHTGVAARQKQSAAFL